MLNRKKSRKKNDINICEKSSETRCIPEERDPRPGIPNYSTGTWDPRTHKEEYHIIKDIYSKTARAFFTDRSIFSYF